MESHAVLYIHPACPHGPSSLLLLECVDGAVVMQSTCGTSRRTGRPGSAWRTARAASGSFTTASATSWRPTPSTSSMTLSRHCPRVCLAPPAGLQAQQRLACKAVFRRGQFYGDCALAWIGLHGLASLLRYLPDRTDAASTACM